MNVYCTRTASCEDKPGYFTERTWWPRLFDSLIADGDASPICVRTMHNNVFRVDRGQQESRLSSC